MPDNAVVCFAIDKDAFGELVPIPTLPPSSTIKAVLVPSLTCKMSPVPSPLISTTVPVAEAFRESYNRPSIQVVPKALDELCIP